MHQNHNCKRIRHFRISWEYIGWHFYSYISHLLSGSLGEKIGHRGHRLCGTFPKGRNGRLYAVCGTDLHANMTTVYNNSEYTTYLYATKARGVIKNHDPRKVSSWVTVQEVQGSLTRDGGHSRRMRNPQFYVSGKRPMLTWKIWDTLPFLDLFQNGNH